jgi:hypothetical protein
VTGARWTSPVFRRLLIGRTLSVLGGFMTMVAVAYQVCVVGGPRGPAPDLTS